MTSALQFIAARPQGSRVVFDYAVPSESLDRINRHFFHLLSKRVAALGEPFRLFFTPEEVRIRLQQLGFNPVEEMGPEQLNEHYLKGRHDDLKIRGGLARLISAHVKSAARRFASNRGSSSPDC
jgi:O-methyltransferase involved in polyketide biosynthesis